MPHLKESQLALGPHWLQFEQLLGAALFAEGALVQEINAYVLSRPGKQLRPLLALLAAGTCATPTPLSAAVAAVVEMLHTASLLHDDVVDRSPLRRGVGSVAHQYGAGAAVLLGDFWFSRAFLLLRDYQGLHLLPHFVTAIEQLSEGELLQMETAQHYSLTCPVYYTICEYKTASLFKAAVTAGAESALIPGAAAEVEAVVRRHLPLLEKAAYHLGMAFQIQDDLNDFLPQERTGKAPYRDLYESKMTLPLLLALEQAHQEAPPQRVAVRDQVVAWMRAIDTQPEALPLLLDFIARYQGMARAQEVWAHHQREARACLNALDPSPWRDHLVKITCD